MRLAATLVVATPGPLPSAGESCAPTADGVLARAVAVRADKAAPPAAQRRRRAPQGHAGPAPRSARPPAAAPAEAAEEPEAALMLTFYTCVEAKPAVVPVHTATGWAAQGPLRRT